MAGEEKTEKATPKKRRDSRKKGEVLQSKEVSNAVFIVGIFVFLSIFGSTMFTMLLDYMQQCLEGLSETGNSTEFVMNVMWKVFFICICTVGPILLAGVVLGMLPVLVQTRGLFSGEAMKPKFSRLNPFSGIKRLFSLQAVVGIVKGLIEITVVVVVLYMQVTDRLTEFSKLIDTDVIKIVAFT
ncbi:MAG: EscU/YscU/HrcU family type III secretion system export apparatus switch protein, partial [Ruminiclostridium sp.]|nr:EscU/YscU/HrcU family type III secretion system export apparatus switch protein [Ruminiclostridium sp.]